MWLPCLMAAAHDKPLWLQLDQRDRVGVIMALLGLLISGLALVTFVWLAARLVRRYAGFTRTGRSHRARSGPDPDDWCQKPLVSAEPEPGDDRDEKGSEA